MLCYHRDGQTDSSNCQSENPEIPTGPVLNVEISQELHNNYTGINSFSQKKHRKMKKFPCSKHVLTVYLEKHDRPFLFSRLSPVPLCLAGYRGLLEDRRGLRLYKRDMLKKEQNGKRLYVQQTFVRIRFKSCIPC
jgi:hypothetical protein